SGPWWSRIASWSASGQPCARPPWSRASSIVPAVDPHASPSAASVDLGRRADRTPTYEDSDARQPEEAVRRDRGDLRALPRELGPRRRAARGRCRNAGDGADPPGAIRQRARPDLDPESPARGRPRCGVDRPDRVVLRIRPAGLAGGRY